jgi:uncharacterized beta barrel domain-containing protein DUF5777
VIPLIEPRLVKCSSVGYRRPACGITGRTARNTALILAATLWAAPGRVFAVGPESSAANASASAVSVPPAAPSPEALGISFVQGSTTSVVVEREGRKYLVDLATHRIEEVRDPAVPPNSSPSVAAPAKASSQAVAASTPRKPEKPQVYQPGDDFLFSLPTGRRLERHGFYVNFSHRFPYEAAFAGKARGHTLMGLDDFSISSFGFRFGITDKFSVSAYRSPSLIGRPIQFMGAYNFLDERDGNPLNAAVRFSVEGQNDFSRNFTVNFEGIFSRSITPRAQVYVVPTLSLRDHPVLGATTSLSEPFPTQPCGERFAAGVDPALNLRPCANTFSLGVGGAFDIRPTVALIAEVIPTLVNGTELGIHRPAYSFGIQKKIWRHAFTFGFSNSPGTTVSQRAGTRATFLYDPTADTPGGLFVGFDLTRQVY